ncbi:MAG: MCE family protein [Deltaproteobacteria bacterium]|nr:MAG: MCE family protein [Deltaproteobacteria bacterium]
MSKKANPKLIGMFVVIALALVVGGVLIFGSGQFFKEKRNYVLYFEGSLKGLNVGAPVLLRGVKIGQVTDIKVVFNFDDLLFRTPVVIEIESDRILTLGVETHMGKVFKRYETDELVDLLVEQGLRAQLQLQSFVTGQLVVGFDMHPGTPIYLIGVQEEYKEIPTIPTDIQTLAKSIKNLRLQEMVEDARKAMAGIERLVNSPELAESVRSLNQTLKDFGKLTRNVDSQVAPLTSSIEETMRDAQKLVQNVDTQVEPLAENLGESSEAFRDAFKQAKNTLASIEDLTRDESIVVYQIMTTLDELARAARTIRVLADYIQRNPDAFLRGKTRLGGK